MRGKIFITVSFIILISLVLLSSCKPTVEPTGQTSSPPTQTTASSPTIAQPQQGGTLKVLMNTYKFVGDPKNMPGTAGIYMMCVQDLAYPDTKGGMIPHLATSWDVDEVNKTITYHLRKGVKFHDGTDFNAAAAKWNLEQYLSINYINGGQYIKSIDIIDDSTYKLTLSQYSPLFLNGYAMLYMFSPTSVQTHNAEWTGTHWVGTGPFELVDYQRDASVKYKAFDGYWGGKPYLDAIEIRVVPDPMTCVSALQAGEADMWFTSTGLPLKEVNDLKKMGYKSNSFEAWPIILVGDSLNADSPYSKLEVRQAVEYAIDKAKIASTLGYGLMSPLNQLTFTSGLGYNKDLPARSYNVQKAKDLLAKANLANGFTTKIIVMDDSFYRDIATSIQGYLTAVGINAQLDIADSGRFANLTRGTGDKNPWNNSLILVNIPYDPGLAAAQQFTRVFRSGSRYTSLARSAAFNGLVDKINASSAQDEATKLFQQLVAQADSEVLAIPLLALTDIVIYQPKVHTNLFMQSPTPGVWDPVHDWKEK
jgi:peptide/nickel transport system substrate-binding protein